MNFVPKTEKAPDTGYMADISPLAFDSFHQFKHMHQDTRDLQGNHDAVYKDTNDKIREQTRSTSWPSQRNSLGKRSVTRTALMNEYRKVVLTEPALKKIPVPMVPPIAAQIMRVSTRHDSRDSILL
jgi:hypothetical protein